VGVGRHGTATDAVNAGDGEDHVTQLHVGIVMFLLTTIVIVLLIMLLLYCYSPASRPFSPQLLPDFLYWHYSPAMFYSDGFEEGLAIISKVDPSSPLSRPCCDEL
jgi:hypothetical protein